MAIITIEKLENADKDADSLDDFVSGNGKKKVKTRRGAEYLTAPGVEQTLLDNGLKRGFANKSALDKYKPSIEGSLAQDMETRKVWLWDGTKWNDTGASEKDLAIQEAQKLNTETLRIVDGKGISPNVDSLDISFGISDEKGNTPFHVGHDGTTNAEHLVSKTVKTDKLETPKIEVNEVVTNELKTETLNISHIENDEWSIAFTDAQGNVAFGIKADGSVFPEQKPPEPIIHTPINIKLQITDWIHGFLYGQSLANGVGTGSVISNVQPYNNICMKSGVYVRPRDTEYYDASDVIPLVEARWIPTSSQIETPTSGFLNKLASNLKSVNKNYVFFGNAGGQSGAGLQQINKGTSYYNSQMQLIRDAMRLAQERGLSYSVHFVAFMQGEANQKSRTTKQHYQTIDPLVLIH